MVKRPKTFRQLAYQLLLSMIPVKIEDDELATKLWKKGQTMKKQQKKLIRQNKVNAQQHKKIKDLNDEVTSLKSRITQLEDQLRLKDS